MQGICYTVLIEKSGGLMDSPLQRGHLPGLPSLSLFANTNPHFLHTGGCITRRSRCLSNDLRICSRCAYTSFSGRPAFAEISFASIGLSCNRRAIVTRAVSSRCCGVLSLNCLSRPLIIFFQLSSISVTAYALLHTAYCLPPTAYFFSRSIYYNNLP